MEDDDPEPHEAFQQAYDTAQSEIREKLPAPHDDLGLVLKCHLIAEDALTNYLIKVKGLPNIHKARLNFTQKVELLDETDGLVFKSKGELKQLNKIRNGFGHDFQATLEIEEDSVIAQGAKQFLKGAEKAYAEVVAMYEKLGGEQESGELLKTLIKLSRANRPDKGKFLGDNHALLAQQEPQELVARFVSSFCEIVAIVIYRHESAYKST
jgi:hypothetical protein